MNNDNGKRIITFISFISFIFIFYVIIHFAKGINEVVKESNQNSKIERVRSNHKPQKIEIEYEFIIIREE